VAQTVPTGIQRSFADTNSSLDIDGTDDYRVDVDIAVIDTGIDYQHADLNVVAGVNCTYLEGGGMPWLRSAYCVEGLAEGDDDHGHGTHVAGSAAAVDNGSDVVGIAPGARLWAVKVLDSSGSGYESNVVAGIDWVATYAADIEVANMSLGGSGYSQAEYDAIQGAVDAGVAFAVAAGNSNADASNYSPAAFDNVLTVSALADFDGAPGGSGSPTCRDDQDDTLADFSNWGSAVDIAAPGVCILSTQNGGGTLGGWSGTSMASPHVAGALGLLASTNNPANAADVYVLYESVVNGGNFDWADDSGDGVQEPLLDVGSFTPTLVASAGGGGDEEVTDDPPMADFSYACSDLACAFTDLSTDDGTISAWSWDFGESSGTSTAQHPSYTYTVGGTYTVTLRVTDDAGQLDTTSQSITVTEPAVGDFSLSVSPYKVKGRHHVDLTWSGATSTNVDIYRDGSLIVTTANDGGYTDAMNAVGGGSYEYEVCEAGTETCSNTATAVF
jgi:subtilisin family serine protease